MLKLTDYNTGVNLIMDTTPKSLRLQLAFCGRINAGKSTLFNLISGQASAITSPEDRKSVV